ncbi:MAG: DNA/RNA nuclease SfsA, partial [Pseudomonadota bacterium]
IAAFPDTVTTRGARHLDELAAMAKTGARAVLFYLLHRSDCDAVTVAADIDPAYGAAYASARASGLDVIAHRAEISLKGVTLGPRLPVIDP